MSWFVLRLPLAYLFAFVFGFGLTGIWLGVTVDYFVRAALLALRFGSDAWTRVRV
jgi:Na+-driven multidrug efflux pump